MGSKHCNTDGKVCESQEGGGGAMSENKTHLVIFYESILVSLRTFQTDYYSYTSSVKNQNLIF